MKKIPVWRTIGSAYGFAFDNLATIIGLIWLPLTLLFVAEYYAIERYLQSVLTALASGNKYAASGGLTYLYGFMIVALFLQAVVAVPVMRQALGLRNKGAFVHFGLGLTELRVFGALVAYFLVVATIQLASGFLLGALTAGLTPPPGGVWMRLGLTLAVFVATLYISVRLSFFLVAVTVAENRIDLIESWTLTEGNFWRIFMVLVCIVVPTWLLYLAIQIGIVGIAALGQATDIVQMVKVAGGLPSAVAPATLHIHRLLVWLPYIFGVWFAVQPLALGLNSGAAAAAYRALVPPAPAVSTPPTESPLAVANG